MRDILIYSLIKMQKYLPEPLSIFLSLSVQQAHRRLAACLPALPPVRPAPPPRSAAGHACSHRRVAARHAPARMPAQPRACRACDAPRSSCHSAFAAPPWEQSSAHRSDSTGPNPCGSIPPSWGTTLTTSTSPTTWPSASSHRVVPPPLTPPSRARAPVAGPPAIPRPIRAKVSRSPSCAPPPCSCAPPRPPPRRPVLLSGALLCVCIRGPSRWEDKEVRGLICKPCDPYE